MAHSDLRHHVRTLLEPTVHRLGFELVAVEWIGGDRGAILRVSIDGPDGISADHCAAVTDSISPLLDEDDPIEARYTLEVSSPGINRPVQRPADFQRFLGFKIKLRLVAGHPRRRYTGVLESYDDGDITVVVDGEPHTVSYESVERANLVLNLDEYRKIAEGKSNADQ